MYKIVYLNGSYLTVEATKVIVRKAKGFPFVYTGTCNTRLSVLIFTGYLADYKRHINRSQELGIVVCSSSSRAFVLVAQGVSPCQFFVL